MMLHLDVRNDSTYKRLYRRDNLMRIADRVLLGEGLDASYELSLLFCHDPFIQELNKSYRKKDAPTDVLSFGQGDRQFHGAHILGDIVISLDTVARHCKNDIVVMRDEVRLLFCHGLLHLIGYQHSSKDDEITMKRKQAEYLGLKMEAAWRYGRP